VTSNVGQRALGPVQKTRNPMGACEPVGELVAGSQRVFG